MGFTWIFHFSAESSFQPQAPWLSYTVFSLSQWECSSPGDRPMRGQVSGLQCASLVMMSVVVWPMYQYNVRYYLGRLKWSSFTLVITQPGHIMELIMSHGITDLTSGAWKIMAMLLTKTPSNAHHTIVSQPQNPSHSHYMLSTFTWSLLWIFFTQAGIILHWEWWWCNVWQLNGVDSLW